MITFDNITKIYPPRTVALRKVSFAIKSQEFISIVGKSGAGKTTLIKLLLREESPTSGRVFFEGKDIASIKANDLSIFRRKIGAIFQDYRLLPQKTVFENVAYAMEVMGGTNHEVTRDVPKILEIVGLENKTSNFPQELSGGEKQRTAIARALAIRPQLIIADEPTGNLDPYHSKDIIDLLEEIQKLGTTVILSTHNKAVINNLKKRVVTLENGKIIRDEQKGRFML